MLLDATRKSRGARAMIWKLMGVGEKNWNKLSAPELLSVVYTGKKFEDGLAVIEILTEEKIAA